MSLPIIAANLPFIQKVPNLKKADNIDDSTIDFEMNNWKNHQSKRYYMENSYDFKIQSIGIYQSEKIIEMACQIIQSRLNEIKESIQKGTLKVETEKIALKIAHQQLESSFCIEKSIGFLSYLEKVNNK